MQKSIINSKSFYEVSNTCIVGLTNTLFKIQTLYCHPFLTRNWGVTCIASARCREGDQFESRPDTAAAS